MLGVCECMGNLMGGVYNVYRVYANFSGIRGGMYILCIECMEFTVVHIDTYPHLEYAILKGVVYIWEG